MLALAKKIASFTSVAAAGGILFRWFQNITIYEEETGLANSAAVINKLIILLFLVVAVVLVFFVYKIKKDGVPENVKLEGMSFFYPALGTLAGVILTIAGIFQVFTATNYTYQTMRLILGLLEIPCGLMVIFRSVKAESILGIKTLQTIHIILMLFSCYYLVCIYKENSADPVLWTFAPEVIALCFLVLAFYYVAGKYFKEPKPLNAVYSCFAAEFFCAVCVADQGLSADAFSFAGLALLLAVWGFTLTENVEKKSNIIPERM